MRSHALTTEIVSNMGMCFQADLLPGALESNHLSWGTEPHWVAMDSAIPAGQIHP